MVRLWVVDPVLAIVGDPRCRVDGNYIFLFLIFNSQFSRLSQIILPTTVPMSSFGSQLPCISKGHLKGSQFSCILHWLWKMRSVSIVQSLLCLMFRTFNSGWLLLCVFGFLDDNCIEVLIQDRFVCSIRCRCTAPFSEYNIFGVENCLGQSIGYVVLLSQHAIPNEYAGSSSVVQPHWYLRRNMHESQAFEHTKMFPKWLPLILGLIWGLANYRLYQNVVLEIDLHWDCNDPVLPRMSGIFQYEWYALHNCAVRLFDNSISLQSVVCSRFLQDRFWL